jgi:hypothetical protein
MERSHARAALQGTDVTFRAEYRARGPRCSTSFYAQRLMNTALVDDYLCPDGFAALKLKGRLSDNTGYFRFGQEMICYGRSTSGSRASRADAVLYDALRDVTADDSTALLPFNPTDVVDNLHLERYANRYNHGAVDRWKRSLRNVYYFLWPMMHVNLRRRVQRAHLNGWRTLLFPGWPVDTTGEDLCERLLRLSMTAKGVDRVPFVSFWPDGAQSRVATTHDLESGRGKAFCTELIDMDNAFGIRASTRGLSGLVKLLAQAGGGKRTLFAVPGEIDHWWRSRSKMRLVITMVSGESKLWC